jgi:uncharacterized protein DUF6920
VRGAAIHHLRRAVLVGIAGVVALAAIVAGIVSMSEARWRRGTSRTLAALHGSVSTRQLDVARDAELDALPPIVARYFRFALPAGQHPILEARLSQTGEFSLDDGRSWKAFDAIEEFHVDPPGFVWDARIHMAPGVDVFVRDSYVAREGAMRGRIAGLVPVVDMGGTPQMAEGALQRYLAEAVWLPTALLPSAGVVWSAIDEHSARATLTDGAVSASFDFRFGPDGEITGGATTRYRDVKGRMVRTRWDGLFSRYARVHGVMIPMHGDVGWILPGGRASYWRGDLRLVAYELR